MNEIYKAIGELCIVFTRVELAMSFIYSVNQIGIRPQTLFNQKISADQKIKLVKEVVEGSNNPEDFKKEIIDWLKKFKILKNVRNSIVHNYVLDNYDGYLEYVEFDYKSQVKSINLKEIAEIKKTIKSLNGLIHHSLVILLKLERQRKNIYEA